MTEDGVLAQYGAAASSDLALVLTSTICSAQVGWEI